MQDRLILKWLDAMAECGRLFTKDDLAGGWPDSMRPDQIAYLQRPWQGVNVTAKRKFELFKNHIDTACESGSIQFSSATQKRPHQITKLAPGDPRFSRRNFYGERAIQPRQVLTWESKEFQAKVIAAPAFAAWLAGQGETPSPHIQAWFDAVGVAGAGQVVSVIAGNSTPTTPQTQARQNKRRDLVTPLIEEAQRESSDPFDAPAIWAQLSTMAEQKRKPFVGIAPDGLQWTDANDDPQFFSLSALRDRLSRQKRPAQKSAKTPLVRVK